MEGHIENFIATKACIYTFLMTNIVFDLYIMQCSLAFK